MFVENKFFITNAIGIHFENGDIMSQIILENLIHKKKLYSVLNKSSAQVSMFTLPIQSLDEDM